MSKPSSIPWWSSFGFGKRAPAVDTDYADMGTAFGLDASMPSVPPEDDQGIRAGDAPQSGSSRKSQR